jgi:hypothetical protein
MMRYGRPVITRWENCMPPSMPSFGSCDVVTHIHNGHYDSLDHIMVSEEFSAQNRDRIGQVTYVSVFNDHIFDQTLLEDNIEPWQSDHGQVVATIELTPPLSSRPQLVER